MPKALVITEKPSVARDIVQVLGGFTEHDGFWEGDDYLVTFAVGHLFELLSPEEVDEKYKRWTLDVLPIIPESFDLKKKKGQGDRIRVIQKLLKRDDVDRVVNACDAGREGELIFREIVEYLASDKPIERLWLQSMTADAIREGFGSLRPGRELEGLAAAAGCRAYSDWLIGMNATRALTKRLKSRKERTAWSAGRVQTPTLALLVDREHLVLAHVPRPFWRVVARFEHAGQPYEGTWFDADFQAADDDHRKEDRIFDEARARAVVEAARGQEGRAEETRKPSRETAPALFDLTSLQREANQRLGWSARRTLGAAQRCYEAHKLLTYPRTDSRCLPNDYRGTVDEVLQKLSRSSGSELAVELAPHARRLLEGELQNLGRTFDDSKVSDHFAIIPTGSLPDAGVTGDDRRLFDLVVRRFLANFHPPATWERVERTTAVGEHRFRTRARTLVEPGWRQVLPASSDEEAPAALPPLQPGSDRAQGVAVATRQVDLQEDETRPPPRLSEARLLSLMENAGKYVEDEDLAAALHEKGLGTPATRADVIENLIAKGYAVRVGKSLRPTVKGIRLIDTLKRVHIDRLASAELTGEIEQHLRDVEHGERTADDFLDEMKDYAREIVAVAKTFEYGDLYKDEESLGPCPRCGGPVREAVWFYRCPEDPDRPRPGAKAKAGSEKEDAAPEAEPDCPMRFWKDTSGRYLDRDAVRALLRDGKTAVLDGFTARNGRTYKGVIEVDREEWKLVVRSAGWNEEGTSDQPEYEVDTDPVARCPICEEEDVVETPTQFVCAARLKEEEEREAAGGPRKRGKKDPKVCGFVFPRTVCKREITRDEAQHYIRTGKTELLEDFTSRFGRPFSATLVLKETGRHGFEFPPRKPRGGAGEEGAKTAGKGTRRGAKGATPGKKTTRKTTRKTTTRKKTTRKKAAAKSGGRKKSAAKKPRK